MANFEVSLPSIPGKGIKFKIQDIKSSAFGTQRARFQQNKCWLTKKFVQSFNNFYPVKNQQDIQIETHASFTESRMTEPKMCQFRKIVPDNKKFLVPIYNQLVNEEKDKISKSLNQSVKGRRPGYSFAKDGTKNRLVSSQKTTNNKDSRQSEITDNYHFTSRKSGDKVGRKTKKQKLSATFLNQTRNRFEQRAYSSIMPGPGTYYSERPQKVKKPAKKCQSFSQNKPSFPNELYLKNLIIKVLEQQKEKIDEKQQKKQQKTNYMFAIDDRDRFGNQIFPIAPKLKVPGPGYYELNDNLEDRIKKVILVQEQRKLLKQWFNN